MILATKLGKKPTGSFLRTWRPREKPLELWTATPLRDESILQKIHDEEKQLRPHPSLAGWAAIA
ncbi:MAG: hypothetical protein N2035_10290 [Chthoniobacterales bacterium]|nr:hypothetical protein [Chthoniobacterales bacterium]